VLFADVSLQLMGQTIRPLNASLAGNSGKIVIAVEQGW
jgi:hypothetical protein